MNKAKFSKKLSCIQWFIAIIIWVCNWVDFRLELTMKGLHFINHRILAISSSIQWMELSSVYRIEIESPSNDITLTSMLENHNIFILAYVHSFGDLSMIFHYLELIISNELFYIKKAYKLFLHGIENQLSEPKNSTVFF